MQRAIQNKSLSYANPKSDINKRQIHHKMSLKGKKKKLHPHPHPHNAKFNTGL